MPEKACKTKENCYKKMLEAKPSWKPRLMRSFSCNMIKRHTEVSVIWKTVNTYCFGCIHISYELAA